VKQDNIRQFYEGIRVELRFQDDGQQAAQQPGWQIGTGSDSGINKVKLTQLSKYQSWVNVVKRSLCRIYIVCFRPLPEYAGRDSFVKSHGACPWG